MTIKKRSLLWDWTNTANLPTSIDSINFTGPLVSISNWNAWSPPEARNRLPFRPTIRGMSQITDPNEWGMISNNEHEIIYFFNEPERAGISSQQAVEVWKEKCVPLRKEKGKRFVSPGCASDEGGERWIGEFMEKVEELGEKPDYLGVHYYGVDGEEAIRYVEKMHAKFPSYLVVVSEIACISRDRKAVFEFTAKVANWMDECPWIFEYAFFGCMAKVADDFVSPEAQLMNADGSLTRLMEKLMTEQPMTAEE